MAERSGDGVWPRAGSGERERQRDELPNARRARTRESLENTSNSQSCFLPSHHPSAALSAERTGAVKNSRAGERVRERGRIFNILTCFDLSCRSSLHYRHVRSKWRIKNHYEEIAAIFLFPSYSV